MGFFGGGGGSGSPAFSSPIVIAGSTAGFTNCLANLDMFHLADTLIGDQYNQKDPNASIHAAKWTNLGLGGSKYDWIQPTRNQAYKYKTNQINGHPALLSDGYDDYMRFGAAGMDLFNGLSGLAWFTLYQQIVNTATITSITGNGTTAVATCSAPLDTALWIKNRVVTIAGNGNAGFNVSNVAISLVSGSTFSFSNATNATGAGGTATESAGDSALMYVNTTAGKNAKLYAFTHSNGVNLGTVDWNLRRLDADTVVNEFNSGSLTHFKLNNWNLGMFTLDYTTNTNNLNYYNLVGGTGSGVSNTAITTPLLTQSVFTGAATATDAANSLIAKTPSSYLDTYGNSGIHLGHLNTNDYAATGRQSFDGYFAADGLMRLTGGQTPTTEVARIRACAAEIKTWSGL